MIAVLLFVSSSYRRSVVNVNAYLSTFFRTSSQNEQFIHIYYA